MKKSRKKYKFLKRGLKEGIAAGMIIIVLMIMILSKFISAGKIPRDLIQLITIGICGIGALAGGYISTDGKIKNAAICALVLALIKAVLTAFSEDGSFGGAYNLSLFSALLLCSMAGGILSLRKKPKRHKTGR